MFNETVLPLKLDTHRQQIAVLRQLCDKLAGCGGSRISGCCKMITVAPAGGRIDKTVIEKNNAKIFKGLTAVLLVQEETI